MVFAFGRAIMSITACMGAPVDSSLGEENAGYVACVLQSLMLHQDRVSSSNEGLAVIINIKACRMLLPACMLFQSPLSSSWNPLSGCKQLMVMNLLESVHS